MGGLGREPGGTPSPSTAATARDDTPRSARTQSARTQSARTQSARTQSARTQSARTQFTMSAPPRRHAALWTACLLAVTAAGCARTGPAGTVRAECDRTVRGLPEFRVTVADRLPPPPWEVDLVRRGYGF